MQLLHGSRRRRRGFLLLLLDLQRRRVARGAQLLVHLQRRRCETCGGAGRLRCCRRGPQGGVPLRARGSQGRSQGRSQGGSQTAGDEAAALAVAGGCGGHHSHGGAGSQSRGPPPLHGAHQRDVVRALGRQGVPGGLGAWGSTQSPHRQHGAWPGLLLRRGALACRVAALQGVNRGRPATLSRCPILLCLCTLHADHRRCRGACSGCVASPPRRERGVELLRLLLQVLRVLLLLLRLLLCLWLLL